MKIPFRILFSALGLILLGWFIHTIRIDAQTFWSGNWFFLFLAFVIFLGIIPIAAKRTRTMLHALGMHSAPSLLGVELGARFLYYVTPFRLNIPGKALLLSKVTGVTKTTGLSLTVLEFTIDSLFTLTIALLGVFFLSGFSNEGLEILFPVTGLLVLLGLIYLFSPASFWKKLSMRKFSKQFFLNALLQRAFSLIERFHSNTRHMANSPRLVEIILWTAVIWALSTFSLWLSFLAYAIQIPLEQLFVVTALGLIVGMLSQVPGGIGFKEASMVFLLSKLGVPVPVSGLVVLWARAFTIVPILLGYFFILSRKENPFSLTESSAQHGNEKLS